MSRYRGRWLAIRKSTATLTGEVTFIAVRFSSLSQARAYARVHRGIVRHYRKRWWLTWQDFHAYLAQGERWVRQRGFTPSRQACRVFYAM